MKRFNIEFVADGADELASHKVTRRVEEALKSLSMKPVASQVKSEPIVDDTDELDKEQDGFFSQCPLCPQIVRGATFDDIAAEVKAHGIEAHGIGQG